MTVSASVGLILTVTVALLDFVVSVLEVMVSSKVKEVSVVTFGARNVALGLLALVMLMAGLEGVVLVQAKFRSVSLRPEAVLEPSSVTSVPTRSADAKVAMEAIGAVWGVDGSEGVSGLGEGEGVGVGVAFGSGISAGLQVLDGAGGVGPGKGERGPYCLPSRKSPCTRPLMSLNGYGGGFVPGTSTSGKIHSLTAAINCPALMPSLVVWTGLLVVMRYSRVKGA